MFNVKLNKQSMKPKKPQEWNLKSLFIKILKKVQLKVGRMSNKELKMFTIRLPRK